MTTICSVSRIFQTNCKLFVCAKEKNKRQKEMIHLVDPRTFAEQNSGNNLLNSGILKRVINWEFEVFYEIDNVNTVSERFS